MGPFDSDRIQGIERPGAGRLAAQKSQRTPYPNQSSGRKPNVCGTCQMHRDHLIAEAVRGMRWISRFRQEEEVTYRCICPRGTIAIHHVSQRTHRGSCVYGRLRTERMRTIS